MTPIVDQDITQILSQLRNGNKEAEETLIQLVYRELHALASKQLRSERPGHTLQTTALVHEAYMRLVGVGGTDWKSRSHFFAVAAQVMRHILVDYARNRMAKKKGGGAPRVPIEEVFCFSEDRLEELIIIDELFDKLEKVDARTIRVMTLRFYGGLSVEEVAEVLHISARTVKRDWNYGCAWLRAEIGLHR